MDLDLDRYFDRIGFGAATRVDHATLSAVLAAHMSSIPFENIDVLLGRDIRIDLAGLERKLVAARRGGYCFEQATLLKAALDALGFAPVAHLARVLVALPRPLAPRTHMMLSVSLPEGTFVVDPGFGALAPRVPVPLAERREVACGDETHWFERAGPEWTLKMRQAGTTHDCWTTTFEPEGPADFAVANHYTATHPESAFRNRIMLRALLPDGRVTLHNRDVKITRGGAVVPSQLPDRAALRALLATHFGFDLEEVEALRVPTIPEWS
jgi:N-hydroxyarylamine O-acetyltransferase